VRSAGFPVSGLDVFGAGDESRRLREVAADPRFREAVTWQNRAAVSTAIDKVATASPASGSKQRQREELVASYWQRYCAKNDTIGYFGPLAWGRMVEEGPALAVREAEAARSVHFEAWCLEALAEALDLDVQVPLGPHPEGDVRAQVERMADPAVRRRGLDALDRLEACREAIVRAGAGDLDAALDALDREFEALTGRAATQRPGVMYAARTLVYLDCMREVGVDVGPAVREELALTLPAVLAGSRWFCGRVYEVLSALVDGVARRVGNGPLAPALGPAMGAIFAIPPEVAEVNRELPRRWEVLLAEPDVTTLAARAEAAFADHTPGWPMSVSHSPDVQVAAPTAAAVDAGDFLCVVGDFHPGTNTLIQGLFSTRHPDREAFLDAVAADWGEGLFLIPPKTAERMRSRIMPAMTRPDRIHVAATPGACMPQGFRVVDVGDLFLHDGMVTDRDGVALGRLTELLELPMFVAGVNRYNPFPAEAHAARLTLSRTVLRRETWQVPAGDVPMRPEEAAGWARARGMPQ
jgi:hypothetical protein